MSRKDITTLMQAMVADRLADCPPGLDQAHVREGSPLPCAVLETWEGGLHVVLVDPDYFENVETKENLLVKLRGHIREHRATAIALMCPVWANLAPMPAGLDVDAIRKLDPPEQLQLADRVRKAQGLTGSLADLPDSREMLCVWSVSQFHREITMAQIDRTEEAAPTLQPWAPLPCGADRFSLRLQQSLIAIA